MEALISEPFYSVLFVGAGVLFLFLEVFVPSGGILGLLSMGCAIFGIYGLFHQGRVWLGLGAIAGTTALAFFGLRFGLRRLSFSASLSPDASNSTDDSIAFLVGKEGVTHTQLRPAGVAIIEGQRVDVVTRGTFLDANVRVRVIDTMENRVVVKELSSGPEHPSPVGVENK